MTPAVRIYETTLAGKPVKLSASFQTLDEMAKRIADPFFIVRETLIEGIAISAGVFQHQPKFMLTMENVATLFHIGITHAGGSMSMDAIKDAMFAEGLQSAKAKAEDYLAISVNPKTEQEPSDEDKSSGE